VRVWRWCSARALHYDNAGHFDSYLDLPSWRYSLLISAHTEHPPNEAMIYPIDASNAPAQYNGGQCDVMWWTDGWGIEWSQLLELKEHHIQCLKKVMHTWHIHTVQLSLQEYTFCHSSLWCIVIPRVSKFCIYNPEMNLTAILEKYAENFCKCCAIFIWFRFLG
jgi:hypothetical protein